MPRKLLARFQFLAESDQYLELLEQSDIPFYLSGMGIEQNGQTNYSESLEVWVDEENFEKAVKTIKENDYFTSCPNCSSKDLSEAVVENLKSNVTGVFKTLLLFGTNRKSSSINYKCNNCGNVFQ